MLIRDILIFLLCAVFFGCEKEITITLDNTMDWIAFYRSGENDYETDEKGMVTNVNLIVGTTHNNAPINMSVNQAATNLIKDGHYDQGILNRVEMAIRAYDPCLSCATHNLDGTIPVRVDIVDAEGNLIDSFKN